MLSRREDARGFTLIEMVISLTIGLIVLGGAMSFGVSTWRTVQSTELREGPARNSRFIQMSLERDLQTTGVGMESTIAFGTLSVWSDTMTILSIPYDPVESPPYDLDPGPGTDNPLPAGGTCGSRCLTLAKDANGMFDIEAGDLARLEVNGTRHLILANSVIDNGTNVALSFTGATQLLRYPAGLSGGLLLDRYSTYAQKVQPIVYYRDGDRLMRAVRLRGDGTPEGAVLAYGVQSFEVTLVFEDGDEADNVNPSDTDATNDYDDIVGVRIRATLAADHPHPRVSGGSLYTKDYEWWFTPRNLLYERNRM